MCCWASFNGLFTCSFQTNVQVSIWEHVVERFAADIWLGIQMYYWRGRIDSHWQSSTEHPAYFLSPFPLPSSWPESWQLLNKASFTALLGPTPTIVLCDGLWSSNLSFIPRWQFRYQRLDTLQWVSWYLLLCCLFVRPLQELSFNSYCIS